MKKIFFIFLHASLCASVVTPQSTSILSETTTGNFAPHIAMNTSGTAVAIWTQTLLSVSTTQNIQQSTQIVATFYNPSTQTWDDQLVTIGYGSSPQVGIDASGNAIVAFVSNSQIYVSHYSASTLSWSNALALTTENTNTVPALAINANGVAAVTWLAYPSNTSTVSVQVSAYDGTSWSLPSTINTPAIGNYAFTPQIAVNNTALPPGPVEGIVIWQDFAQTQQTTGQITTSTFFITSS